MKSHLRVKPALSGPLVVIILGYTTDRFTKRKHLCPEFEKKKVFREIVGAKTLKEKPFKCGVCCYQSARQNSVKAHFKNLHQSDSFICHCGFRTCFKRTYDKHVQHHKMFSVKQANAFQNGLRFAQNLTNCP